MDHHIISHRSRTTSPNYFIELRSGYRNLRCCPSAPCVRSSALNSSLNSERFKTVIVLQNLSGLLLWSLESSSLHHRSQLTLGRLYKSLLQVSLGRSIRRRWNDSASEIGITNNSTHRGGIQLKSWWLSMDTVCVLWKLTITVGS